MDDALQSDSYPRLRLRVLLVRLQQGVRTAYDLTGLGQSTPARICSALVTSTILFFANLVAAWVLEVSSGLVITLSLGLFGLVFLPSLVAVLFRTDEQLLASRNDLEKRLPAAKAAWETYKAKVRAECEARRQEEIGRKEEELARRQQETAQNQQEPTPRRRDLAADRDEDWDVDREESPRRRRRSSRSETILLDEDFAFVSTARVELHGVTYAMANVTSVRMRKDSREKDGMIGWGMGCMVLGIAAGIMLHRFFFAATAIGAVVFIYGLVMSPRYYVVLVTSGEERSAYSAYDAARCRRLTKAINQAMVERG